jgi:hypothetical protein
VRGGEGRWAATFPAAGLGVRRCRHPHWPAATSRPAEHRITSVLSARHAGCAVDKAPGEWCPAVMWCMTAGLAPVADRPDRADLPASEESLSRSCPRRDDEMHDVGRSRYRRGRDSIISRAGHTRAAPREVRDQFGKSACRENRRSSRSAGAKFARGRRLVYRCPAGEARLLWRNPP